MRVIIIDDHPFVRKGLLHVMQQELKDEQVEADEADSFDSASTILATDKKYDLALLDISLGGRSGLDLLKLIRQRQPELPVLVVSMHPEDQYALRTMKMGAAGYLSKHSAPDDLTKAIKEIRSHGNYISPAVSRLMAHEITRSTKSRKATAPHELLTNREMEIAGLIASGCRLKQIGEDLNLSIKTVATHRTRILKKIQIANNAELATYFIRNGLLQ